MADPVNLQDAEAGTPEWWLKRLLRRLETRAPALSVYDDYYNGRQPLAFASDKFREAFGDRFGSRTKPFTSNFSALVVDGTSERLAVQGFRFNDPKGDKDLWAIWQANDMDGESQIAHTEALVKGIAYALVTPGREGEDPVITVEDPLDAIVERDPLNRRRRLAALKRWIDDDQHMIVYVYLPDQIAKYRTRDRFEDRSITWEAEGGGDLPQSMVFERLEVPDEEWPLRNTLGVVPIVELPNRPRLKREGQSEIAAVMGNQDAINKYRVDALVAAEYAAFRQRWAIGLDIPTDPDTGKQVEPFKAAIDHLWVVPPSDPNDPNPPKVQFGEFAATDLGPYKNMIELEVGHMSSISRMPYHYLLGQPQAIPPSGESLKSSEAGLIRKIGKTQIYFGEGWEEAMRLALRAKDDERADLRTAETIWADEETQQVAAMADAAVKLHAEGILDDRGTLEFMGWTQTAIDRLMDRKAKAAEAQPPEPEQNGVADQEAVAVA